MDEHEFQATTCGLDTVYVPFSVARPFVIGVYGHPAYTLSKYALRVTLKNEDTDQNTDNYDDEGAGTQEEGEGRKTEFLEILESILSFLFQILIEVLT